MDVAKKYEGKDIHELGKLFFQIGNADLVPELSRHFALALEKFAQMQEDDDELYDIIVVADTEARQFVFATGDGSDLEDEDSDCVFYIAKSDKFGDCMELLDYIAFGNHPEGYLNVSQEACHWISDAQPKNIDEYSVAVYYNHFYGEAEDDPVYEG